MITHDKNRQRICLVCMGKANGLREIHEQLNVLIQKHVFQDFIQYQGKLPCAICDSCRKKVSSHRNADCSKWLSLPDKHDYVQLLRDIEHCTPDDTNCGCRILHNCNLDLDCFHAILPQLIASWFICSYFMWCQVFLSKILKNSSEFFIKSKVLNWSKSDKIWSFMSYIPHFY